MIPQEKVRRMDKRARGVVSSSSVTLKARKHEESTARQDVHEIVILENETETAGIYEDIKVRPYNEAGYKEESYRDGTYNEFVYPEEVYQEPADQEAAYQEPADQEAAYQEPPYKETVYPEESYSEMSYDTTSLRNYLTVKCSPMKYQKVMGFLTKRQIWKQLTILQTILAYL